MTCLAALATLLVVAVGCNGRPTRGAVAGKVTLDGQAVDGGSILFVALDGRQKESGWAKILAGEYTIAAVAGPAVGSHRVEIRWPRKTGRKSPDDPNLDEWQEAIPNQYHRDSHLQAEIQPGKNRFDFALQSQWASR